MDHSHYIFVSEIADFNLADYSPVPGWESINEKHLRAYTTREDSLYFLYDMLVEKMYSFTDLNYSKIIDPKEVIVNYYLKYPRNHIISMMEDFGMGSV